MSVDASAVARVLGISTTFRDLRGGNVKYLPQSIAVFAQGATGVSYPSTKWQATSAGAGGARFGYGSPIHLILLQLMPLNGDGVGTIPVNVYPLSDAGGGSAPASGDVTPSGTATVAHSQRLRIGGVQSLEFAVPVGAVNVTNLCGAMGDAINGILEMPVRVTYDYGTVTGTAGGSNAGNGTITALSAPGTPRPGNWTLTCNTAVTNGGVFTLRDPLGSIVSSAVTMTVGVGAATVVTIAGLQFTLTDGTNNFAVGDLFTIAVPATSMNLISKWHGVSANAIKIEVLKDLYGVTYALTQLTGGLINPSVTSALAQVGNVWETMVINALDIEDTTALDAFAAFGEGRWGELVHKPLMVFTGNTATEVADATVISHARATDRVNGQLVSPNTKNLPFVVNARQLARMAKVANDNPPTDYCLQQATGLLPGPDGDQWDYTERDQAVKRGSSTVEVIDGVVNISNVVTFYHPTGEEPPAYRSAVDIVKLQNIIFNLNLIFAQTEWAGAPLVPDDQPITNPRAKKPRMAKAAVWKLIDNLAAEAIISDPAAAKASVVCSINAQNPKRMDVRLTVKLSGNTNIVSVDLNFGFYYPVQVAA